MPNAARRPCWQAGCPNYQPCTQHVKKQAASDWSKRYDKARGTAAERGYGSRWQNYSKHYRRINPVCGDPYKRHIGQVRQSEHVDHIVPVSGPGDPLFWKASNHQALCQSCHSWKTAHIDGGFANQRKDIENKADG